MCPAHLYPSWPEMVGPAAGSGTRPGCGAAGVHAPAKGMQAPWPAMGISHPKGEHPHTFMFPWGEVTAATSAWSAADMVSDVARCAAAGASVPSAATEVPALLLCTDAIGVACALPTMCMPRMPLTIATASVIKPTQRSKDPGSRSVLESFMAGSFLVPWR